jgi:hypothetical protein
MSLYLKIALPGLILGIFSLTVPEGARSQPLLTSRSREDTPRKIGRHHGAALRENLLG